LLEGCRLAPYGFEPMLASHVVADHALAVFDPTSDQGPHGCQHFRPVLRFLRDAVSGDETPPAPLPPVPGGNLLHETELSQASKVVTARGWAFFGHLGTLRGGGCRVVLEVRQDGRASRMRQRPHHLRVGQLDVVSERHVSKIYFQIPGLSNQSSTPSRRRAATGEAAETL